MKADRLIIFLLTSTATNFIGFTSSYPSSSFKPIVYSYSDSERSEFQKISKNDKIKKPRVYPLILNNVNFDEYSNDQNIQNEGYHFVNDTTINSKSINEKDDIKPEESNIKKQKYPSKVLRQPKLFTYSTDQKLSASDYYADGNKKSQQFSKGGGQEFDSSQKSSGGKKGKKGFKNFHNYEKGQKGHHDKESYKGKFNDAKGKKGKKKAEAGYYGEHHKGEKGKKAAQFAESGEHKKGHKTNGVHNIHKKDEYLKKYEFYDEHHEGGDHEKNGGYHGEHYHKKGGKKKKGHHHGSSKGGHHGKKGNHEKGSHDKEHKGHKKSSGDSSHYSNSKKYGKKGGQHEGKKWGYSKGKH